MANRPPSLADFSLRYPPFNHLNYEFIMFGSGWRPEGAPRGVRTAAPDADLARRTSRLISALPDNAKALRALHS